MEPLIDIYQDMENKLSRIVALERDKSGLDIWKEVPRDYLRGQHIFIDEEEFSESQNGRISYMIDWPEISFAGNIAPFRRIVVNANIKTEEERNRVIIYEYACYLLRYKYWEYLAFGKQNDDPEYRVSIYSPNYEVVRAVSRHYLHVTRKEEEEPDACYLMFYLMGEQDDKIIPYLGYDWMSDENVAHEGKIIQFQKKWEEKKWN